METVVGLDTHGHFKTGKDAHMGDFQTPSLAASWNRSFGTVSVSDAHQDLVDAIQGRRLGTAFQPIVDLVRGRILGVEALVRPRPTPSFSTPAELFDRAEQLGLLWILEDAIRRATFRAANPWPEATLLFLNTTPDVIAHESFPDTLLDAASEIAELSPDRLVIEITERSTETNLSRVRDAIDVLRSRGVQIALDDVGAGENGLKRITQVRPDWLKLDRGLIAGIDSDPVRQHLVRSLVDFASSTGVGVIAEGIERRAELSMIVSLGVGHAQGFLIGCPSNRRAATDAGAVNRTIAALAQS
jgi:EAL domain-containing protein (putative c-di-GMP-specific phosphodiesterase class I)